jgi:hypothetical protein
MHTIRIVDATVKHRAPRAALEDIAYAVKLGLREFADDHGLSHSLDVRAYAHSENVPGSIGPHDFTITLLDTLDVAGAVGYHYTNPDGTPAAVVGVAAILGAPGGSWTEGVNSVAMVIDHEAKETELDRSATLYAFDGFGRAWAREACDAVQSDTIDGARGVTLSNYVLPNYFIPGAPGPYDKLGKLRAPLSIAPGGYAILADYTGERDTWSAWLDDRGPTSFPRARSLRFGSTEVAPDPDGRGIIVVHGDLPEWAHDQKAQESARTMRRLLDQQQRV